MKTNISTHAKAIGRGLAAVCATALMAFTASCDSLSIDERIESAPEIEAFTPGEGTIGSEIIVTGHHLNDVVSATIGGQTVEIMQKVSDTRLSLKVTDNAQTGVITLKNALGTTSSDETFTILYVAPSPLASSVPTSLEMGNNLLISGSNMGVISEVIFTAVGGDTEHVAEIISQSADEIVVRIPYVESDDAVITFRYFDGTTYKTTSKSLLPQVSIKRFQPVVTTTTYPTAHVDDEVTLSGEYLNKINSILLNGTECKITYQFEGSLSFIVPALDTFTDGDNTATLSMVYFDGVETKVLTDQFNVFVPPYYFWQNRKIYAQAKTVEEFTSFFSPETGIAYANELWKTAVDPIAYQYRDKTCSKNNVPAVSEAEYNSVNPYFFFSGLSAGTLQLNSPAGSKTQIRNFYIANGNDTYRVTGDKNDCYGTPALAYMYLDPDNSSHAAIVDAVREGTLTAVDEQTFPLDATNNTLCGFSITDANVKQALTSDDWAPGKFPSGKNTTANADAVVLVFYYNVSGMGSNRAANVKRLGLLHIKTVEFLISSGANPGNSSVTFDMYWMKYDYDYSKVK